MATKKEIDDYCKKSGYTRKQLAQAYKDAKEVNTVIQLFAEVGITWDKMAIHQIEELVGLKERTIENLRKKEEEEAKRAAEKKKKDDEKKYYKEHIDEIIINKLSSKEPLSESEIIYLIDNYEISTKKGEDNRWTRDMFTVVEINDKHYAIPWRKGLTEKQENEYSEQPYEVIGKEKTIVITVWERKEN